MPLPPGTKLMGVLEPEVDQRGTPPLKLDDLNIVTIAPGERLTISATEDAPKWITALSDVHIVPAGHREEALFARRPRLITTSVLILHPDGEPAKVHVSEREPARLHETQQGERRKP